MIFMEQTGQRSHRFQQQKATILIILFKKMQKNHSCDQFHGESHLHHSVVTLLIERKFMSFSYAWTKRRKALFIDVGDR
jgi:hypothetical protein